MKREIEIRTADGVAKAGLFQPAEPHPRKAAVILYMDAFGPRPALDEMAGRIADMGYTVLVPDLFYRHAPYGPFPARTTFSDEKKGAELRGIMAATSQDKSRRDTGAFLMALDDAGASGAIGTVGYCMGGARALNAAAAYPQRIAAVASIHGGNLASDADDSPHRSAASMKARVYVGCAGVDKSFPPEQSAILAEALRSAEVDHMIENYVGAAHGWAVPDHGAFNPAGADRHWKRLETLFAETL